MAKDKRSFFERLTGTIKLEEEEAALADAKQPIHKMELGKHGAAHVTQTKDMNEAGLLKDWNEESSSEGQLTVDVYQTPSEIVIKTIAAGVKPEDLDISITRDMVVIKGRREGDRTVNEDNYFYRELYWGTFSRTILLPVEVEPEEAEAVEKHGLLMIRLPKINKERQTKLRVKTV